MLLFQLYRAAHPQHGLSYDLAYVETLYNVFQSSCIVGNKVLHVCPSYEDSVGVVLLQSAVI